MEKWENTLLAFDEDIKKRTLLDWIKAHTSGFKPLHRYREILELNDNELRFDGIDTK